MSPAITLAKTRGTPYLRNRMHRRQHIAKAIEAAGGNTIAAERMSEYLGKPVDRNRLAQWRNKGYVPFKYCFALVAVSGALFEPSKIRHRWAAEAKS